MERGGGILLGRLVFFFVLCSQSARRGLVSNQHGRHFSLVPALLACVLATTSSVPQGVTTMVMGVLSSCDVEIILIGLLQLLLTPLLVRWACAPVGSAAREGGTRGGGRQLRGGVGGWRAGVGAVRLQSTDSRCSWCCCWWPFWTASRWRAGGGARRWGGSGYVLPRPFPCGLTRATVLRCRWERGGRHRCSAAQVVSV